MLSQAAVAAADREAVRTALEHSFPPTEDGLITLGALGEVLKREDRARYLRLCPNDRRDNLADVVDALLAECGDTARVQRGFAKYRVDGVILHRRWVVRGRAQVRERDNFPLRSLFA